jgi:phasin family protein
MMAKAPETDTFMDMFKRLGEELKLPRFDVDSILAHHRKNLEALQKSASAGASGASSLMSRQREITQDTVREITEMAQGFRAPGNPQEMMSKQADFVRRSFETTVKNASESAEIMRKSGTESLDILRNRIREAMAEIREGYDQRK